LTTDSKYMYRCLELAKLGAGHVAPNPMVGAVLVYDDRIIGEGWHQQYGKAHAEVNCIASVKEEDKGSISQATLYVSLEPCAHFGKTPPCSDLIIKNNIPKVVIGSVDPFIEVDGKGMERLRTAGVRVEMADQSLQDECKKLNKRFFTFHKEKRPYVVLKWAQTADGKIASGSSTRLFISNEYSNRLVHQWRSEEASILVGTNTALQDDPELTTRLWPGASPVRLVVDMDLSLPPSLRLLDQQIKTIVFNTVMHEERDNLLFYQITRDTSLVHQVLNALYQSGIQSVLVEGGARMIQSFIDDRCWDEIRVITNEELFIGEGVAAPKPENAVLCDCEQVFSDSIETYFPSKDEY
jgi:diaminohydroxyphosphoribosylaminopyrimidine deaminase / 5-amino-6-(5-phosphoribosylamino)uracil reductase